VTIGSGIALWRGGLGWFHTTERGVEDLLRFDSKDAHAETAAEAKCELRSELRISFFLDPILVFKTGDARVTVNTKLTEECYTKRR